MTGTVEGWTPKTDNEATEFINVKAEIYWANLDTKNEMSEKYQVDLCNLSELAVRQLEKAGVEVKSAKDSDDPRGRYITAKSTNEIHAYDTDRQRIYAKIGNGSKATVVLSTYDWDFKGKSGTSASIRYLTITDLIEFEPGDSIDWDVLGEAI